MRSISSSVSFAHFCLTLPFSSRHWPFNSCSLINSLLNQSSLLRGPPLPPTRRRLLRRRLQCCPPLPQLRHRSLRRLHPPPRPDLRPRRPICRWQTCRRGAQSAKCASVLVLVSWLLLVLIA